MRVTTPACRDPSDDYPPSRPTLKMLLVALAVVAAAVVILNWPQLSANPHVVQIKADIQHAVGL
jgi:hypothetical protein